MLSLSARAPGQELAPQTLRGERPKLNNAAGEQYY
jgi:hypothetical protein